MRTAAREQRQEISLVLRLGVFQHCDERQVAITFGEVQTITNDKLVRNLKTKIINLHFLLPSLILIEQRRQLHTRRAARVQVRQQVRKRKTSIDDVFNDEYVTSLDRHVEILHDANL